MGVFFPNKQYNSAAEASMALLKNRQMVQGHLNEAKGK
jgi:hypothetical protein